MKNRIKRLPILLFLLGLGACEKWVLGPAEENTPENNFELFWSDFDRHYGLFLVKPHLNWDSLYQVYRPQVSSQSTDSSLFAVLSSLIEHLDDSHTHLIDPENRRQYSSGGTLNDSALNGFSMDLLLGHYIEEFRSVNDSLLGYGHVKGRDIGYIEIRGMEGDASLIDEAVAQLKQHKAIILDLRRNGGGLDPFSERIAGAFADGEHLIYTVQTRNGESHADFTEKRPYYTHPVGAEPYLKPLIVLTSRYTISAAEICLLHLNSFPQATQIGDTTAGDFSDMGMLRFLPNGWGYTYSIQMYLLPDGRSLDALGHVPDVYIKNTTADIAGGQDLVFEAALQYLFDTYGIQ